MNDLLHQVCDESRYFSSRAGLSASTAANVELKLVGDVPLLVDGDYNHLVRLFSNLLDNALRHTPRTGTITFTGSVAPVPNGKILVSVRDTGEGIAPEHLSRICERFLPRGRSSYAIGRWYRAGSRDLHGNRPRPRWYDEFRERGGGWHNCFRNPSQQCFCVFGLHGYECRRLTPSARSRLMNFSSNSLTVD